MNGRKKLKGMSAAIGVGGAALLYAASASASLNVAVAGPMTGEYASGGEQFRKGAEQAVKDINAAGGVLGQQLNLIVGDDVCDPKQAVSVANDFVNKKVAFVNGHWCSSSTLPASDVYNDAQIPEITVSTNPKITERGIKGLFRITGRDDQQGSVTAAYIADHFKGRKIAVIDDKTAYGGGLADEIAKGLAARQTPVALRQSITAGERDYSGLISKMKVAGVQVLAYGGYYQEVALILRQAAQTGLDLTVIGGDTLSNNELVNAAGPQINKVLFTFPPDPRKSAAASKVVAAFRAQKIEPEGYMLYSYAAMQAYADAAKRAKSTDYAAVVKQLHDGTFDTVVGQLKFDSKGDLKNPGYVVYRWNGNSYDYVK
ncbi:MULTISPECIES: branched-chain amino acid ABC transporter substrate-binding protein [Burkholderia]|uniref:branched-chain amino acid ABC transporter substrate-binding protein n=1 Tax=Burkholderia TaxID=32008 RepID=UPI000BF508D9|nr:MULTISPECIES: branched-chain amino acid ABC transporter substrate-binding protein [Burkholderia]PFH19297.1 amino acid/amide ABC transporter substrate-binding protein (HAAT family) [Burkholderia sp. JKS000303]